MTAHPPEINPYASPRDGHALPKKRRPKRHVPGEWVKWVYGAVVAVSAIAALSFVSGVASEFGLERPTLALASGPLYWMALALGAAWIYLAWSGIPIELRRWTTPASAVLWLFVPLYGFYWAFAVNTHLCRHVDTLPAQKGDLRHAPKGLGIVAAAIYFVPTFMALSGGQSYAFLVQTADQALWRAYMFRCDALRRAVIDVRYQAPRRAAPTPGTTRDEYDEKLDQELRLLDDDRPCVDEPMVGAPRRDPSR